MRRECASELYSNSLQLSGFRILAVEEGRKQRDPDLAGAHEVGNPRIGGIMLHAGVPRGRDRTDSPMAPQFLQPTRAPPSSLSRRRRAPRWRALLHDRWPFRS